jgi:hypothetical protein
MMTNVHWFLWSEKEAQREDVRSDCWRIRQRMLNPIRFVPFTRDIETRDITDVISHPDEVPAVTETQASARFRPYSLRFIAGQVEQSFYSARESLTCLPEEPEGNEDIPPMMSDRQMMVLHSHPQDKFCRPMALALAYSMLRRRIIGQRLARAKKSKGERAKSSGHIISHARLEQLSEDVVQQAAVYWCANKNQDTVGCVRAAVRSYLRSQARLDRKIARVKARAEKEAKRNMARAMKTMADDSAIRAILEVFRQGGAPGIGRHGVSHPPRKAQLAAALGITRHVLERVLKGLRGLGKDYFLS